MSLRTLSALVFVSTSLLVGVGCAADPADVEGVESAPAAAEAASDALPKVQTDGLDTEASGQSCVCPEGKVYQAGLCYTPCKTGWDGEGPVCWKRCASGFTDTGFFCHREGSIVSANTSKCPWYNKCGLGDDCSTCPSGYENDGCTCRRDPYIYAQESYGRGAGTTPTCTTY